MKDCVSEQDLDNEWREHALLDHEKLKLSTTLSVETYWKRVFEFKNAAGQLMFPNLKIVVSLLLVLPFSNASVERVFSNLNNIKTENRNKLSVEVINSLLITKQAINEQGGMVQFEPTEQMYNKNIWQ